MQTDKLNSPTDGPGYGNNNNTPGTPTRYTAPMQQPAKPCGCTGTKTIKPPPMNMQQPTPAMPAMRPPAPIPPNCKPAT